MLSIIIPTFNRSHLLGQTLESIINQTYKEWECIVVDDGSSDNTEMLVSRFQVADSRIVFLKRPDYEIRGANTCRNLGLKIARGEFVKWLDSDDCLHPECFIKQINLMKYDSDVCFCQCDFFKYVGGELIILRNRTWGKLTPHDPNNVLFEYLMKGLRWQTGSGLWRREFLTEKPFLEGLRNSQEWLMHLTMLLKKPNISFLDEKLVHVRVHEESMSNARNKKGNYYYHQCRAHLEALMLLKKDNQLSWKLFRRMGRFIIWNHLFIFYKGSPLKGFLFFLSYPKLISAFLAASRSR